ncbi:MAG: hypothetical protein ACREJC_01460 [Tepidisphaeraceae bacterium]
MATMSAVLIFWTSTVCVCGEIQASTVKPQPQVARTRTCCHSIEKCADELPQPGPCKACGLLVLQKAWTGGGPKFKLLFDAVVAAQAPALWSSAQVFLPALNFDSITRHRGSSLLSLGCELRC